MAAQRDAQRDAQRERDRVHWGRVDRETREHQKAAKARAAAREQLANVDAQCTYCGAELRDDGFCYDCEWAFGGLT